MGPEHGAEAIGDLAERGVRHDGPHDRRHQVVPAPRRALDRVERVLRGRMVPAFPECGQFRLLRLLEARIDLQDRNVTPLTPLSVGGISIDADDDLVAALQRLLVAIGRLLDLALLVAGVDRPDRTAPLVDLAQIIEDARLDLRGESFEPVGTAERVDGPLARINASMPARAIFSIKVSTPAFLGFDE